MLLYDGICASTCTLASEFLRLHAGVKSIALGGRPHEGSIQGVGGVKGSQSFGWADIYNIAQDLIQVAETDEQTAALKRYSPLPMARSTTAGLNVRDQILHGNVNDGIPAPVCPGACGLPSLFHSSHGHRHHHHLDCCCGRCV